MLPTRTTRTAAPLLLTALLAAACAPSRPPGRAIESIEMVDLSSPGMFLQLAIQLDRPHVLEMPATPNTARHDLKMENTTERAVLEELCRLEPEYQFAMDGQALLMWPTGEAEQSSPFSRRLSAFRAEGSVESVLRELIGAALPDDTLLVAEAAGRARPVQVDLEDLSVREALAAVAAQAHLMMTIEPGYVRVAALPE